MTGGGTGRGLTRNISGVYDEAGGWEYGRAAGRRAIERITGRSWGAPAEDKGM
ncbi:MAG: hypothetical protein LBG43_09435 [Treponema sp.]|jgi:hypothetical protein|nr:hypothetical protein [Treponema sp.]